MKKSRWFYPVSVFAILFLTVVSCRSQSKSETTSSEKLFEDKAIQQGLSEKEQPVQEKNALTETQLEENLSQSTEK